jgi:hypothetical protein
MKKFILFILLLFMAGCGYYDPSSTDGGTTRFKEHGVYDAHGEQCVVRILEDTYTGCQYLVVCNSPTAMPHTCNQDKANEVSSH